VKITEDGAEVAKPSKPWHVLQEREARLHLANDADRIGPEVTLVVLVASCSCDGEWLAREARRDEIHASSPWSPVEGGDVVPDRGVIEISLGDPSHEDALAVGVSLDVADDAMTEELACPESTAAAGK